MKKIGKWLCLMLLVFSMAACQNASMQIIPIELSQEEQEQSGWRDDPYQEKKLFDFSLNRKVQSVEVNIYEFIENEWQRLYSLQPINFSDQSGRMKLKFDCLADGAGIEIQGDPSHWAISYSSDEKLNMRNKMDSVSFLTEEKDIVYEQEIPLAIQVINSSDLGNYFIQDIEAFYMEPSDIDFEYDHIYVITLMFSQEPAQEFSEEQKNS